MTRKNIRAFVVSAIGFAALALPGLAAQPTTIDFSSETIGAEPKALVPVVGIWRIDNDNGKKGARRRWTAVEGRAVIGGYRR
jgi:hypothetical protein